MLAVALICLCSTFMAFVHGIRKTSSHSHIHQAFLWAWSQILESTFLQHLRFTANSIFSPGNRPMIAFSSVTQSCPPLCDPWTAACQASLSITNSWSLLKLMSIESVMPSNHLILCFPFSSHLPSFPASGFFQMSQFLTSGGQSIGVSASASVLPMNIQDWFPLECTGWISLQSKGLSRVFSNTTVQKHQFFGAQLFL